MQNSIESLIVEMRMAPFLSLFIDYASFFAMLI